MTRTLRARSSALLLTALAALAGCDSQVPLPTEIVSGRLGRANAVTENTYQSTDVPKALPDNQMTFSTLQATNSGYVTKVVVQLNINHTNDRDMVISLISPAGTVVVLSNRRPASGVAANYSNTVFDDAAATAIGAGVAPFAGTFIPDQPLSWFNGEQAQGTWSLRVQDAITNDVGTLTAWSLTITTTDVAPPPPAGDITTLQSTDVPKTIVDLQTVTSTLSVPDLGPINKLTVKLNITHTFDSDIQIRLTSPAGTTRILVNKRGGGGKNFTNTVLDDASTIAVASLVAPFAATVRPDESLSAFNGQATQGTWTLSVQDFAGGDQGTINSWSLTFSTPRRNALPVAAAGSDQDVVRTSSDGANVTLNGSGSSDSDGTIASYQWFESGSLIASGVSPQHVFDLGTHNVTLRVTDDGGATNEDVVVITVANALPTAAAGSDRVLSRTSPSGVNVMLDGSASSDVDGTIAKYEWLENGNLIASGATAQHVFGLGLHAVTLRVTDNNDAPREDEMLISVQNAAPTVSISQSMNIECTASGRSATFDATANDVDGTVSYLWSTGATTPSISFVPPMGTTPVSVTVTDNDGATAQASTSVTVSDQQAPQIYMIVRPSNITQVNHQMVLVAEGVTAADACDPTPSLLIRVSSSEDVSGGGSGNTNPDWSVVQNPDGSYDISVRAERSGGGDGRVYTITATATDASGNFSTTSQTVTVRSQTAAAKAPKVSSPNKKNDKH